MRNTPPERMKRTLGTGVALPQCVRKELAARLWGMHRRERPAAMVGMIDCLNALRRSRIV